MTPPPRATVPLPFSPCRRMATLPDLPLPQTLRLLDRADALRLAAVPLEPTREQLVEHLQTVCESLGNPLDPALANQAVEQELTQAPVPTLPQGGPLKRPGSVEEWEAQKAEVNQGLAAMSPHWERAERISEKGENVCDYAFALGFLATCVYGFLFIMDVSADPLSPLFVTIKHVVGWLIPMGWGGLAVTAWISTLLRPGHDAMRKERRQLEKRLQAMEALSPEERPTVEQIAAWCRAPGVSAACHQILTSGVPFLRSDAKTLEVRYEKWCHDTTVRAAAEKKAREQRDRDQWDQDFRGLVSAQQPSPAAEA